MMIKINSAPVSWARGPRGGNSSIKVASDEVPASTLKLG
jgi:hypothetical protein